ncbi:MAG: hypothetical protein MUP67_05635 [Acidimicrobiia bacterium]|nr:hypothetical protein [Acidimicrobiia bacterium]
MGMFKKLAGSVGHVSKDVMENGLLGRGQIAEVKQTGMTMGGGENTAPTSVVCKFTVQVVLDNVAPYEATCKQRVSPYGIPPPGMVVAVRVNPDDHSEIGIDWETAPPAVALAAQPGQETATDILAEGSPARAVIVQSQPLGMKNPSGLDLYGFLLTIMVDGTAPYQIQVGNPVTPGGVPLIFPGSNLPAKYMPAGSPESVAIDWDAAVAEATNK